MTTYTEKHKRYYHKKKAEINFKAFLVDKEYRTKYRASIFEMLGYKCARCGFDDVRALQIDHKNGGGNNERKLNLGRKDYYKRILDKISEGNTDYQILCANCNWIKRFENNENKNKYKI